MQAQMPAATDARSKPPPPPPCTTTPDLFALPTIASLRLLRTPSVPHHTRVHALSLSLLSILFITRLPSRPLFPFSLTLALTFLFSPTALASWSSTLHCETLQPRQPLCPLDAHSLRLIPGFSILGFSFAFPSTDDGKPLTLAH